VPLWGELGPHLTQCRLGRGLPPTKWHLDPCSRLATKDMGRKLGGCCASFWRGGAGSPSNTMWPGPRPTYVPSGILIHPAVWPHYMGRKMRVLCASFLPGELGPHLAQCGRWLGLSPTAMPSFILIHTTVWLQYNTPTPQTDRTDNGPIA